MGEAAGTLLSHDLVSAHGKLLESREEKSQSTALLMVEVTARAKHRDPGSRCQHPSPEHRQVYLRSAGPLRSHHLWTMWEHTEKGKAPLQTHVQTYKTTKLRKGHSGSSSFSGGSATIKDDQKGRPKVFKSFLVLQLKKLFFMKKQFSRTFKYLLGPFRFLHGDGGSGQGGRECHSGVRGRASQWSL